MRVVVGSVGIECLAAVSRNNADIAVCRASNSWGSRIYFKNSDLAEEVGNMLKIMSHDLITIEGMPVILINKEVDEIVKVLKDSLDCELVKPD